MTTVGHMSSFHVYDQGRVYLCPNVCSRKTASYTISTEANLAKDHNKMADRFHIASSEDIISASSPSTASNVPTTGPSTSGNFSHLLTTFHKLYFRTAKGFAIIKSISQIVGLSSGIRLRLRTYWSSFLGRTNQN